MGRVGLILGYLGLMLGIDLDFEFGLWLESKSFSKLIDIDFVKKNERNLSLSR